jgi:hypothetical protein
MLVVHIVSHRYATWMQMIINSIGPVDQNPRSLQEMCTALFVPVSAMPSRWFCLLGYHPGYLVSEDVFDPPFGGCVPAGIISRQYCAVS